MGKYLYSFLLLFVGLILIAFSQIPDGNLHIIACDVGQGDAVLIVYKNIQIVTDAGPDLRVLRCLGKYLPFWDRDLELLVLTHSDADHSGGMPELVKRFKVGGLLVNPIDSVTPAHRLLQTEVPGKGIGVVNPSDVQSMRWGMMRLDIVHPDDLYLQKLKSVNPGNKFNAYAPPPETNSYSLVYVISFKNFKGVFTGDINTEVGNLLSEKGLVPKADYIKIPHHGSANGLSDNLLKAVEPKVAVISVDKNNPWGLPSAKILELLKSNGVKIFRTDLSGDVEFVSDGENFWTKKDGALY